MIIKNIVLLPMILLGWLRKVQPAREENNFLFPNPKGWKIVWGKLFIVSCYLSFEITTEGVL